MEKPTKTALQVLAQTSRTFFIPISKLPKDAQEAVASAYLCLRAIDQVQDHPQIQNESKAKILRNISLSLQRFSPTTTQQSLTFEWCDKISQLPEVTLRLSEWVFYCPENMRGRVADCTATMADRMAFWADRNWLISNQDDLDTYTFAVAGAVGLLLSEIWAWYQNVHTDRSLAIAYGRGLQSVNILRNSGEDLTRGVTFYPPGWTQKNMIQYSRKNLQYAQKYIETLDKKSAAYTFCAIPYALAEATVGIIEHGASKLTRESVMEICKKAVSC